MNTHLVLNFSLLNKTPPTFAEKCRGVISVKSMMWPTMLLKTVLTDCWTKCFHNTAQSSLTDSDFLILVQCFQFHCCLKSELLLKNVSRLYWAPHPQSQFVNKLWQIQQWLIIGQLLQANITRLLQLIICFLCSTNISQMRPGDILIFLPSVIEGCYLFSPYVLC